MLKEIASEKVIFAVEHRDHMEIFNYWVGLQLFPDCLFSLGDESGVVRIHPIKSI